MSETGIGLIDLNYLGLEGQVCAAVLPTRTGFLLVDCGPANTLEALVDGLAERGFSMDELRGILLTHIHLDHAGAAGALAARVPEACVYVQGEFGAPHVKQPERLLRSCDRLYGGEMMRLFGGMEGVAEGQVVELAGGERLTVDGRRVEVVATPGHAWHHLAYMDAETRVMFTGDAAGLRARGSTDVVPYTPPPEIELGAWRESVERMRGARPSALVLTHFGAVEDPGDHLERFERRLGEWSRVAREIAARGAGMEEAGVEFADLVGRQANRGLESVANIEHCGRGLARYWTKVGLPTGRA